MPMGSTSGWNCASDRYPIGSASVRTLTGQGNASDNDHMANRKRLLILVPLVVVVIITYPILWATAPLDVVQPNEGLWVDADGMAIQGCFPGGGKGFRNWIRYKL